MEKDIHNPFLSDTPEGMVFDRSRTVHIFRGEGLEIPSFIFTEMNRKGRDLFIYVIYNIQENNDFINLKLSKVRNIMHVSRGYIIDGIKELVRMGILSYKCQSQYWINPHCLFLGSRISRYNALKKYRFK